MRFKIESLIMFKIFFLTWFSFYMICTSADSKFPAFDQSIKAFLQQRRVAAVKNWSTFVLRQPSYSIVTLAQFNSSNRFWYWYACSYVCYRRFHMSNKISVIQRTLYLYSKKMEVLDWANTSKREKGVVLHSRIKIEK